MTDRFANDDTELGDPIVRSAAVVPGDAEIEVTRGLFVQTGGTLNIRLRDDATDWSLTVGDQTLLPCRVKIVRSTGTTAAGIRALY